MGKEEAPHRTDQRPQTALLALSTSTAQLQSVPMPSNLLTSCYPPPTSLPHSPLYLPHSWLRFGLCARWHFGKPSYLATNRMKCRENRCTIFLLCTPPASCPHSFPHSSSTSTACKSFAVHPTCPPCHHSAFVNDIWDTFTKTFYVFRSKSLRRCPLPSPANAVLVAD